MVKWLLMVMMLSSVWNYGQDSLMVALMQCEDEKSISDISRQIFRACNKKLECCQPYIEYLKSQPNTEVKLGALNTFSSLYYVNDLLKPAKDLLVESIKIARNSGQPERLLGKYYNSITLYYKDLNVLDSALLYAQLTSDIYLKTRPEEAQWSPNYNRYMVYLQLKDYGKADEYLKIAYNYLKKSTNRMDRGFVLHTMLLAAKDRWSKAEFDRLLDEFIAFKMAGSPEKKLDAAHSGLLEYFDDKELGIKVLEQKLAALKKDSISVPNDQTRLELADKYEKAGLHSKALAQLDTVLIQNKGYTHSLKNTHLDQYKIYKSTGQFQKALTALESYMALQDSSYSQVLNGKIAEYEAKYQTQLKENELMRKNIELKDLKLDKTRLLGGGSIVLLMAFSGLMIYYRRLRYQKKINLQQEEINRQKILDLEQKNKLLALSSMIEGQESERLRIAQDLHDGLGGLLTSVKAHFNTIAKELDAVSKINVYQKTNELIDEACGEVRRIAHDMMPQSLTEIGLEGSLAELKTTLEEEGIDTRIDIHFPLVKIPEEKISMLYRILQEIVQNTIKHASAKHLLIQFFGDENNLHILTEDDGRGFDINELINKKGLGLKSLESRIQYLHGDMDIDSKIGIGTTINMTIPIP